jgi:signal transduction histidine kinase
VSVADDGVGFEGASHGAGLGNLADRVAARGGRFEVDSAPGRGTVLRAVLKAAADPADLVPADPADATPVLADTR